MKRIFLFAILALLISGSYLFRQTVLAQSIPLDEHTKQRILAATVQIKLKAPLTDEAGQPVIAESNGSWHTVDQMAQGLGTLTQIEDKLFIVTHDHWGALLATAVTATFQNAQGDQLAEISGNQFRSAILYQDQGTMVLSAPAALAGFTGQAVTANRFSLQADTQVQLVRHQPSTNQVTVVTAKITAVTSRKGVPAYQLQHLDDAPVFEGDSGGGIWFNGMLVGNMWRNVAIETVQVVNGEEIVMGENVSANSIAAAYPDLIPAMVQVNITEMSQRSNLAEPALP